MPIALQVLALVHLIGFAALLGGVLVQSRTPEPEVNLTMLSGAWLLLLTGAALFVLVELSRAGPPTAALVVKSLLTVVVVVLVAANRRYASIPRGLWALIGGLALANTAIAVWWR